MDTQNLFARYPTLTNEQPHEDCSGKYSLIPTTRPMEILAANGWFPTKVTEARTASEARHGKQRHMVRFQNPSLSTLEARPEIVLVNAHDGGSAFKFLAGVEEVICLNGLMVNGEKADCWSVRHVGYTDEKVNLIAQEATKNLPRLLNTRENWQRAILGPEELMDFAADALATRFPSEAIDGQMINNVLFPRFWRQNENTLWNVFNRAQDWLVRGGVQYRNENGQRVTQRKLTSIPETVRVNQRLWAIAERYRDVIEHVEAC